MTDQNNDLLLKEDQQTAKQISRTLWWVEHREKLGTIGIMCLIVLDACLVLFVAWSLIDAFLISSGPERRALIESVSNNQSDLHAYTSSRAASPIVVSDTRVFASGNNTYDFYTRLENQNADWWAEFNYQFSFDGGTTEMKKGFILPNSTKPIAELAYGSNTSVDGAIFQIQSVSWHRIDRRVIADYTKWSQDRLALEIKNPLISQDTSINAHTLFRTSFTVKNNTAFNYQNPTFYLLLKRGTTVLGINKAQLQVLNAGDSQEVVVNWFGAIPVASQLEVVPDLNLFDPQSYQALQGTSSLDSRSMNP